MLKIFVTMKLELDENIAKSATLPGNIYGSTEIFKNSIEKIFTKSWHFVTDEEKLKTESSVFPFFLGQGFLDEPLVFTKNKEGELNCMSNVCTHRGNILVSSPQKMREIVCCYHGKRFGLDGCFKSMPGFQQAENFPTEKDNLKKVSFSKIGNLLFASLFPNETFEEAFGKIEERINFLPLDQMKEYENYSRTYLVKANWMLYCENYLEGFHIPFVHPGLNAAIDFGSYDYEIDRLFNLQLGIVKESEEAFDFPKNHPDAGRKIGAYYYWLFPNTMLNVYPWGISVNVVRPIDEGTTKVDFKTYIWDITKYDKGAGSDLDKVEREDEEIVERVQIGVKSRLYDKGRFSPSMEKGVHHFQSLIAEFLSK